MNPLVLPELGTNAEPVRISAWFVEPGDWVTAGEALLEVVVAGIACEIPTLAAGRVERLVAAPEALVFSGDVLAWIAESDQ